MRELTVRERRELCLVRPVDVRALLAYVRGVLQCRMPAGRGRAGGGPLGYLAHAFFEGEHQTLQSPCVVNLRLAPAPSGRGSADCVVWACRGGGKTTLGAIATLLDMMFKPGIQVRILAGSFEQASRMYGTLVRMLAGPVYRDLLAGEPTQRHVELINGSRVEVLSQSERSVRGMRVHKLRCDEVELFEPEVWEAAQLTTISARCGPVEVRGSIEAFSTMHRAGGMMARLVDEAQRGSRRLFAWGVMDVLEHCHPTRVCERCALFPTCGGILKQPRMAGWGGGFMRIDDAIDQLGRVGEPTWRAEMLCERPSVADSVYPEFDEKLHVFDGAVPVPASAPCTIVGGIDFGYRSPTVVLWGVVDGEGDLWITRELVVRERTTIEIIEMVEGLVAQHGRPVWVGADPAGGARSEQTGESVLNLWKRTGYAMRTRIMNVADGITAVRARLKRPDGRVRLRVHRSCAQLIEAMTAYRYEPAGTKRGLDEARPLKDGHDHACDALRYLVTNLDRPGERFKARRY